MHFPDALSRNELMMFIRPLFNCPESILPWFIRDLSQYVRWTGEISAFKEKFTQGISIRKTKIHNYQKCVSASLVSLNATGRKRDRTAIR